MISLPDHDPNCFSLVLKRCWKTFLKRSRKCRSDPTPETVHQYRVASRRLLAELRLLRAIQPGLKSGRVRKLLNASRKELGDLRDTQVQRELLTRCAVKTVDLRALEAELEARERRLCRRAGSAIKRSRLDKLEADISRVQVRLAALGTDAVTRRRMFRLARKCAQEGFNKALRLLANVDYSEPGTIHRLRIAFKQFRYTVEALPETMVPFRPRLKRSLSGYQDAMGRIQDLEVLASTVTEFGEANPDEASRMVPLLHDLEGRRRRAITAFRRKSSRLAGFWPPEELGEVHSNAVPALGGSPASPSAADGIQSASPGFLSAGG